MDSEDAEEAVDLAVQVGTVLTDFLDRRVEPTKMVTVLHLKTRTETWTTILSEISTMEVEVGVGEDVEDSAHSTTDSEAGAEDSDLGVEDSATGTRTPRRIGKMETRIRLTTLIRLPTWRMQVPAVAAAAQ